jgi:hypothetical protein
VTQGKTNAFDESGVERAGKPERFEALGEVREVAQAHAAFDPSFHSEQALSESAAAIGFLDVAVKEVERHLPTEFARSPIRDPLTEMGGDRIEVEVEAVAGEDGETAWSQDERDGVEQGIGHRLGAWTDLEGGDEFSGGVKGHPHPQVVRLVAPGGEQLIELQMTQVPVTEEMGVHLLGVLTRPRQPETHRHFGMAEEQLSIREGQTEIDGEQDLGDLGGRGAEAIEGCAEAAGEAAATRLTA